ncbi:hypothetical protein DM860_009228 [Cuscuta australis]|uniref:3'-5' exonuclease domain-containing protein n=1 Tax=Cuscuta australis TaxID=267555 RepID=A0A328DEQ9_9ASTE|nr:hypothetical protein DM860_009228 [Cuscuta australis]
MSLRGWGAWRQRWRCNKVTVGGGREIGVEQATESLRWVGVHGGGGGDGVIGWRHKSGGGNSPGCADSAGNGSELTVPIHWSKPSKALELPKPSNLRLGNWDTPVLSKEHLSYAAKDAFVSWHLYQVLKSLPDAPMPKRTWTWSEL